MTGMSTSHINGPRGSSSGVAGVSQEMIGPRCMANGLGLSRGVASQESFGSGARAGDALLMPADVIDRWFAKFSERYRRDPDFFTRSVGKS